MKGVSLKLKRRREELPDAGTVVVSGTLFAVRVREGGEAEA